MNSDSPEKTDGKGHLNRAWVADIVRRTQRGDSAHEAFEVLFREYEPMVRRQLRRRGWSDADLDDLVQDVMIRVYRGMGQFRLDASLSTWILQTMSNTAKNAIRDRNTGKARATRASLDSLLEKGEESGPALAEPTESAAGPLDRALVGERKARLAAALEQLPARMRRCLLFRYQGYKYREIAEAQGVSVATVKKQVIQGHKRLRPILGQFVELFSLFVVLLLLR